MEPPELNLDEDLENHEDVGDNDEDFGSPGMMLDEEESVG